MSLSKEILDTSAATASIVAISSAEATAVLRESAIKDTIQQILALRKGLGAPVHPSPAIAFVKEALAKSAETWKKVDWRTAKSGNNRQPTKSGRGASNSNSNSSSSSNSAAAFVKSPSPLTRGSHSLAPRTGGPPPKYVSRFKGTETVDDAILNLIQGKLNKFSQRNYTETHAFLCQILDEGKTHFLKDFMNFVFKKATREELMCPSYAQLLCDLVSKYPVLLTEMVERYREFSSIFADVSEEDLATEDYTALLEANSEKAYRLGYAQFLGELIKYDILNKDLFVETLNNIITKIPTLVDATNGKILLEEYGECLMRILRAIQNEKSAVATALRTVVKERFLAPLEPYTAKGCCATYKGLSPKGRFMILDITDMIRKF